MTHWYWPTRVETVPRLRCARGMVYIINRLIYDAAD
jgi:hypothetical protein